MRTHCNSSYTHILFVDDSTTRYFDYDYSYEGEGEEEEEGETIHLLIYQLVDVPTSCNWTRRRRVAQEDHFRLFTTIAKYPVKWQEMIVRVRPWSKDLYSGWYAVIQTKVSPVSDMSKWFWISLLVKLSWDGGTIYLYFPYFPFLISLYFVLMGSVIVFSCPCWSGWVFLITIIRVFVSLAVDLELFETECARVGRLTCVIGDHDSWWDRRIG